MNSFYNKTSLSRFHRCNVAATLLEASRFKEELDALDALYSRLADLPEVRAFAELLATGRGDFGEIYQAAYKRASEIVPVPLRLVRGWICSNDDGAARSGKVFIDEKTDADTAVRVAISEAVFRLKEKS